MSSTAGNKNIKNSPSARKYNQVVMPIINAKTDRQAVCQSIHMK